MLSAKNKKNLIKIAILFGMFVVITAILSLMIFLAQGFKKEGLKKAVQEKIELYEPKTYRIQDYIDLKMAQSASAAVYKTKNIKNGDNSYFSIIVRIPSIIGPLPAVFLYREHGQVQFIGYAVENGKASSIVESENSSGSISYWQNKIPRLLKNAGVLSDDK